MAGYGKQNGQIWGVVRVLQSLEFDTETRILAEMKIKNRGTKIFSVGKKSTSILFFDEN